MRRIFTPSKLLGCARELRRDQTDAEKKLWGYLRGGRLQEWKFRRQVSIGSYIVDFCCESAKLIVEVDGSTHGEAHEMSYDKKRTEILQSMGYRVFRCFNLDVYENLNGVLDGILLKLNET